MQNASGRNTLWESVQTRTGNLTQHVTHIVKIKASSEDTEEGSSTSEQHDRAGCPAVASSHILDYGESNIVK